jgi:ribosomal protein S18 acetylase RimI-like enzyme
MDRIIVRSAGGEDWPQMWPIFHTVVAGGDSYVFAPGTPEDEARAYWFGPGIASFVAERGGRVQGMYKLVANQRDLGAHVANASFMVAPETQGRGMGEILGRHALDEARRRGFRAMQFNFVVSTNAPAVRLWQKLGFSVAGVLPGAFRHARLGFVDVYVMYRML